MKGRLSDEDLDALRADAAGFRGTFAFEPENEHCPDRIVYTGRDFGDEHVISDCIEPEVAMPIARLLNASGAAVAELRERRAADLTGDERAAFEQLRHALCGHLDSNQLGWAISSDAARLSLAVLSRLLSDKGGTR